VTRPRLLDLFCGAGGAAMGYHRAGFDVVGVDLNPQPHYPFEFYQRDVTDIMATEIEQRWITNNFHAIHASPPCQHYARVTAWRGNREDHPDLIGSARELLQATGLPWVLENVPEAPVGGMLLCGSMFGLDVRRHRRFETSWDAHCWLPSCSDHHTLRPFEHKQERAYIDVMGCDWMNRDEGREAIPPAYTEFIGTQLLAHLEVTTCPRP
jgi:DNA (cytosine-5)-methyltransferase 1